MAIPKASLLLLNLNQHQPSKKWFFWPNPYKIEVITSLIEMLELPIIGHMVRLQYNLNNVIKFC